MEDKEFYKILVSRYINKQLSDDELELFVQLTKDGKLDDHLLNAMNEQGGISESEQQDFERQIKIKPFWFKLTAAAVVLITLSVGIYSYFNYNESTLNLQAVSEKHDVEPGGNKAILTLADGREISLTDAGNGQIAKEAGVAITKNASGQLVYTVIGSGKSEMAYNTITTPRGGQYQVNLPDGTSVWLNAASSIKFPTSFANVKDRKVELKGEAYFEVFKNKNLPFIVVTDKQEVEVLGTHFNINSYDDETSVKTTLLEGSVKVSLFKGGNKTISRFLRPGEQANVEHQAGSLEIVKANIDQVMAWQKGFFHFEADDLQSVLRQLSRWYDVDVIYEVSHNDDEFMGDIPRNVKLSEVLKILEFGGVHFKIDGKKLIVTK
jgi:ribosomal protein S4E